jgi:hypothetical protein
MSAYLASMWRGQATADAPSSSDEAPASHKEAAAVRELAARLEATDVEALLRRGGEAGLAPVGLGEHTLRRWLVAEKWDVDAAFHRLVGHAQWRADYVSVVFSFFVFPQPRAAAGRSASGRKLAPLVPLTQTTTLTPLIPSPNPTGPPWLHQ